LRLASTTAAVSADRTCRHCSQAGNGFAAIESAIIFIKSAGSLAAAKEALATVEAIKSL
jgi:hypothetical protein